MAPLRTLATAVLGLHMIAGAAQAQEIGGPNSAGFNGGLLLPISNSSCPWGILEDKLGAVDGACCLGSGEAGCGEAGGGDEEGQCTVACATKLLPLVEGGCRPILNLLYDTDDGEPDGVATIFDTAAAACHSIPPIEALHALGELEASGDCAANGVDSLSGVAATRVAAPVCQDLLGDNCAQMVGIFSCETDFISGGSMAGKCDATCHICGGGGGHRRLAMIFQNFTRPPPAAAGGSQQLRRRQLQSDCSPEMFAAGAEAVTAACCAGAGDQCDDGVATVCDAECGLVYIDFFRRCSGLLESYPAAAAYRSLYTTCHDGLPLVLLADACPVIAMLQGPSPCSDRTAPPEWQLTHRGNG